MATIYKTFPCSVKAIDVEAGIYELMPSTESVDRDGDILLAAGARLDNFRRNPVVMYAHNYQDLPVAKALEIEAIPGQGLRAQIQFPPKGVSERADTVHGMWAGGFLNAASVGFVPSKWEERKTDNGSEAPRQGGRIYTNWELLEFSIVPIPSNSDALRLAAKRLKEAQVQRSPACRQDGETADECIARKIPEIMEENPGMEQDQAIAVAASMCEKECGEESESVPEKALTKRGRVLSAANENRLRQAKNLLDECLSQLGEPQEAEPDKEDGKEVIPPEPSAAELEESRQMAELESEFLGLLGSVKSWIGEPTH